MFGLGKKEKKKPETTMNDGFNGKEVYVNPSEKKKRERNKNRLERVLLIMAGLKDKGLTDSTRYKSFKAEALMREAQIKFNTIKEV